MEKPNRFAWEIQVTQKLAENFKWRFLYRKVLNKIKMGKDPSLGLSN